MHPCTTYLVADGWKLLIQERLQFCDFACSDRTIITTIDEARIWNILNIHPSIPAIREREQASQFQRTETIGKNIIQGFVCLLTCLLCSTWRCAAPVVAAASVFLWVESDVLQVTCDSNCALKSKRQIKDRLKKSCKRISKCRLANDWNRWEQSV